jgi:energy-coupling factor transport system permease protein
VIHPAAWLFWLAAAVLALSATRNPFYLLLILACIAVVARRLRETGNAPALPVSLLRLAGVIIGTSALFNLLTAHFGQTVLFSLPKEIPLLGGPYTLEALVFGVINGLVLAGFLGAFSVLIMAVPTHALIRLIPRAFYPIAVVISIAIAFVPATLSQFQQIREAQLVRGHRVRGLRDWLPLLMPLLVSGLERAFQLAEAMTARGFGALGADVRTQQDRSPFRSGAPTRGLLAVGLLALLMGLLLRLMWGQASAGLAGMALGAALVGIALWMQGRAIRRTVYRTQRWAWFDSAVAAGAIVTTAGVLVLPQVSAVSLGYSPYPKLAVPPFDPLVALALLGLAVPGILIKRVVLRNQTDRQVERAVRGEQGAG